MSEFYDDVLKESKKGKTFLLIIILAIVTCLLILLLCLDLLGSKDFRFHGIGVKVHSAALVI